MDTIRLPLLSINNSLPSEDPPGLRNIKRPSNKIPLSLRTWVIVSITLLMIAIAAATEIALLVSENSRGFSTGNMNTETVQWWSGFIPTLAIGPLVWIWRIVDNDLRRMQPYVVMSQGPTEPEKGVLLDLEHDKLRIFAALFYSLRHGHYLILASSLICIINVFLHPIAGSFFLVKPGVTMVPLSPPIKSIASLGLNPSYKDVSSFVAAAGFAEAAAFHNLSDPPFIQSGWAVAQFKPPLDVTRNSTITANTTGVLTNVTCSIPTTSSFIPPTPSTTGNWTLTVSLDGCTVIQSIDSSSAASQYGVKPAACSQSSSNISATNTFSPVLFWFYTVPQNGTPIASAVFCKPAIVAYGVKAVMDSPTGLLVDVSITGNVDANSNNVTGGNFAGKAFNGISFDDSDFNLTDPFVRARALAVESGVPGTIFRVASDTNQGGGLEVVFKNATGFLELTNNIYTRYLSLVALANYFTPVESDLNAVLTTWPNRLWINPNAAHLISTLLFVVAVSSAIIHYFHRQRRQGLYLASYPGSMAHYMSLLSHAHKASTTPTKFDYDDDAAAVVGDSGLVGPLDSEETMKKKLRGMRFELDNTSGTLVQVPNEPTS